MTVLFLITAALYTLASLVYLAYLFGRVEGVVRMARWALALATLVHLGMIGWYCSVHRLNPVMDLRGALGLTALLLCAGFLISTVRSRMSILGAFVTPLALVLLVAAQLTPRGPVGQAADDTLRALGHLHIGLSAFGVSAMGLAAAVALIYLFQESALKRKKLGPLFRRTPPLNTLDEAGRRLILVGFPLFTLAMITGVVWVAKLPGHGGWRPEYVIAGLTWLVFGALILTRVSLGWRGKRAAQLTVLGFGAMVAVLLIYLLRRVLGG